MLKLTSIADNVSFVESIPNPCTPIDLKAILAKKFNVDDQRVILTQDDKIIVGVDDLSSRRDVKYFIAESLENVTLKEDLGAGTFGEVYKVTFGSSNNVIAMKKYKFQNERCKDFIREFLVMSKIKSHENIVKYFGVYVYNSRIFIGMEYVPGGSLRQYLEKGNRLREEDIRILSVEILHGLKVLHDMQINHRDIKGSNVLLCGDNFRAKLCDFGFAKILEGLDRHVSSQGISQTGECGTLYWMAPEVLRGDKYDTKADIWSVGATVVEMITGKIPFDGFDEETIRTEIEDNKRILYEPPPGLSSDLINFVQYCLTADTKSRPDVNEALSHIFLRL